jgi:hypothetical protein
MFESSKAAEAVAAIRGGVDTLLGLDHGALQRQESLDLLRDLETQDARSGTLIPS